MDLENLKRVLQTQKEEIQAEVKGALPRAGLASAQRFLAHPNILAILGVRRCGKSIFSLLIAEKLKLSYEYINFYDERLLPFQVGDFEKLQQASLELSGEVELFIFDEIQQIKGWELFVSRLRKTKKVIITGSSSLLLSGEMATYLTGRHIDLTLYPFSFQESIAFRPNVYSLRDAAKVRMALKEYLEGSGFPEYKKFGSTIVRTIYGDIITKDCLKRYPIREELAFRKLAHYLVSNYAQEFSYSKLSHILGIKDVHTTSNYVHYLQQSFLIIVLERYSPQLKQQILAPKKVYAIDHGLSNFVSFQATENLGRRFENVVLTELLRRKTIKRNYDCFYYKNHQGEEVDFVIKEEKKVKELIQVCYDPYSLETKKRELRSLIKASRELRCTTLTVITNEYEQEENIEGKKVTFVPLWKWLLR